MAKKANQNVTMRIRLGDNELEVMGPTDFVEQKISEFIELNKKTPLLAPSRKVPTSTLTVTKTAETVKKISAGQFFKKVKPGTDLVRTLTAGYYLEVFTGVDSFTAPLFIARSGSLFLLRHRMSKQKPSYPLYHQPPSCFPSSHN